MTELALLPVSPNTTSGRARFEFLLPREADVSLTILDITGRRLQTLASGRFGPGRHPMIWEGHGDRGTAPAGVYFVRFTTAGRTITRRFILVR